MEGGDKKAERQVPQPVLVHPRLDALPVYVRGGSILPMQPLTQSTNETSPGTVAVRVYPGRDCQGRSIRRRKGPWRTSAASSAHALHLQSFADSVKLHIGAHEGSYRPW